MFGSYYDTAAGTVTALVSELGQFRVAIDSLSPVVTPSSPARVAQGGGISVSVTVVDNVLTNRVTVYYRIGGENEYRDTTVIIRNGRLDLSFGPEMSSPYGFDYYVLGEDGTNLTLSGGVSVAVDNAEQKEPQDTMKWRLISVPMSPADTSFNQLFGPLGGYDPSQWKVYAYENGGFKEVMKAGAGGVETGKSYWLIIRNRQFKISTGQAVSVPTDKPYEIVLKPGWNLVSNSFMFDVSWTALKQKMDSTGIGSHVVGPFTFNGEKSGYYRAVWNGCDEKGRRVASGVYLYRMSVRGRANNKMLFNMIRVMRVMR